MSNSFADSHFLAQRLPKKNDHQHDEPIKSPAIANIIALRK